jgi:hypothetical protein
VAVIVLLSDPNWRLQMATMLHVEAARIPDRDRLLWLLQDAGLDAHAVDEVGIEVPCEDAEAGQACDDLFASVEGAIFELGGPFVPVKHDGVVYIRPPLS